MPLIKTFSGPRMALFWYFARTFQAPLLIAMSGTFVSGLIAPGLNTPFQNVFAVLLLLLTWLCVDFHRRGIQSDALGIYQQLPVSSVLFILVEFLFFVLAFMLIGACYDIGYGFFGPGATRAVTDKYFLLAALGAGLQVWYWLLRATASAHRLSVRVVPYMALPVVLLAVLSGLIHDLYGPALQVLCALTILINLGVTLYLASVKRDGEDAIAPHADSEASNHSVGLSSAFASRYAARSWFERRALWPGVKKAPLYSAFILGAFFLYAPAITQTMPGRSILIDVLCVAAALLRFIRTSVTHQAFEFQVPLSDWARSTALLRLFAMGLALIGIAGLGPLYFFGHLQGETGFLDALWTITLAIWSTWIALVLFPGILLAMICLLLEPDADPMFVGSVSCLVWLSLVLADASRARKRTSLSGLLAMVSLIAVFMGLYVLPELPGPTWLASVAREGLGAATTLTFLYFARWAEIVPKATLRKLRLTLSVVVALSCLTTVMLGPIGEGEQGIPGIFLAFGMAPPVFLPLLIVPHYFAEKRFRGNTPRSFTPCR